jgi:hypothetical protein
MIQDSHIFRRVGATYQATENVSQENPYTPFEETVAQILLEYNVVLKSPEKIATYLFTHPYRYNIMNHLYFGIVSHFTQKNVDPVPVLTSIEDSVKHDFSRVLGR